jgi:hypothetical protein
MKNIQSAGFLVLIAGLLILLSYPIYIFLTTSEIPAMIKLGFVFILIGALFVIVSLASERLEDLKKERKK